jgi:hypothetical protein
MLIELYLVPRLKTRGAVYLQSAMSSWLGALVKDKDNCVVIGVLGCDAVWTCR